MKYKTQLFYMHVLSHNIYTFWLDCDREHILLILKDTKLQHFLNHLHVCKANLIISKNNKRYRLFNWN